MNPEQGAAGHGGELSILQLIVDASLVVQFVMLLLVLASIISWALIFNRWQFYRRVERVSSSFEDEFWNGGDLAELYRKWKNVKNPVGLPAIFVSGFRDYVRVGQHMINQPDALSESVQRSMRVAISEEEEKVENHLSTMATIGSVSPYIGLFGTVWGIMNSFTAIGAMQQATVASVAPGIAEALVATAMGLFAAIPAYIAYNRYASRSHRLLVRFDAFAEEFTGVVNRFAVQSRDRGDA